MKRQATLIITAIAAAACLQPCVAQPDEHARRVYVTPLVAGIETDSARAVGDEAGFMLAAGWRRLPAWNLELALSRFRLDGTDGDNLTMNGLGMGALRVFRRDERIEPYLLVGAGARESERESGMGSTDPFLELGAGLLATLRRSDDDRRTLALRVDLRGRRDDADNPDHVDYLFGIGLQYAFGAGRPTSPAGAAAPPPAPPPDEDSDGVPDPADACPGTPAGAVVDGRGCELDADHDTIPDGADACPRTPTGARIDARGCEIVDEIELPLVTFATDSDQLMPGSFAPLDRAAETLRMNPDLRIEVAGHTDDRGSLSYNADLSLRRAETVRRYLADRGVTNELNVRGYGETQPVATNTTAAGRARNRRVVLMMLSE